MGYDYEQTHQSILINAKKLFLLKGYERTNIREICTQSGVTNGAFYKHFESKDDLFASIVGPCVSQLKQMYLDASEKSIECMEDEKIIETMKVGNEALTQFIYYIYQNIDEFNLLVFKSQGTSYANFIEELVNLSVLESKRLFELAKKRGLIDKVVSERSLHMITHSYFTAVFECIKHEYSIEETLVEANTLIDFFNAGWMKYYLRNNNIFISKRLLSNLMVIKKEDLMNTAQSTKLKGKDLITVGIYTVFYLMIMLALGFLGFIPIFIPLLAFLTPLFGGIPFMLFYSKVKKFGMITLMGIIIGLLMFLFGMTFWPIITGSIFGLFADLIAKASNYKKDKKAIWCHGIFGMWIIGNFVTFYVNRAATFQSLSMDYGAEYVSKVSNLLPYGLIPVIIVGSFICGILGGILGKAVFKKHFEHAGIV